MRIPAKSLNSESGFSLAETLVAVAILGIMSAASLTMFMNQSKQMSLIQAKFGNMSLASDLRSTFESASLCKDAFVGDTFPAADAGGARPLTFKLLSSATVADKADLQSTYQVHVETLHLTSSKLVGTNWAGHPIYSGVVVLQTQRPEKPLLFAPMIVGALFIETDKAGKVLSCANFPTFSDPFTPTATPTPTPSSRYDSETSSSATPIPATTSTSSQIDAATAMAAVMAAQIQKLEKSVSSGELTSASTSTAATPTSGACTNGESRQTEGKCGSIMEICMNGNWYDSGLSGQCDSK